MLDQPPTENRLYRHGKITSAGCTVFNRLSPQIMAPCLIMIRGGISPDELARMLVQISRDVEERGWGMVEEMHPDPPRVLREPG